MFDKIVQKISIKIDQVFQKISHRLNELFKTLCVLTNFSDLRIACLNFQIKKLEIGIYWLNAQFPSARKPLGMAVAREEGLVHEFF